MTVPPKNSQPVVVYTLDARDNIMLEVIRDYWKLDNNVMHREIQGMHAEIQGVLAQKGIQYSDLKSALIPAVDRNEAGFIFDSQEIESNWYGNEVAKGIIPLLDKRSTHSVLCGDLLGRNQQFIFDILNDHAVLARSFEFVHSSLLYCVYINNLSDAALQGLHDGLAKVPAYIGYLPATFQTRAKTYLSTTLIHLFIKHRDIIIMGHEDDRPNDEDVNMHGYPYEKFGYKVKSLQSSYYGLFLGFKIERAVYKGFEVDAEMSLNAVSNLVIPLTDCVVQLDEAKHEYLKNEKRGKLEKAGIESLTREELSALIKNKIYSNYIYNMTFMPQHNVIKFNLILEVPREDGGYPTRLLAALEFRPQEKVLRVITLH